MVPSVYICLCGVVECYASQNATSVTFWYATGKPMTIPRASSVLVIVPIPASAITFSPLHLQENKLRKPTLRLFSGKHY